MTDQAEPKGPTFTKSALKTQGPTMPLGLINANGAYSKGFGVRPWRMKEEKELARLKKDNQGASLAQYVSMVLSTMCTSIGQYDFDSPDFKESAARRAIVSQMHMGDVFYIYTYLRREAIGNELPTKISCRRCGKEFEFIADLDTIEVRAADSLEPFCFTYKLKHPINIRGKQVVAFVCGPARWAAMESIAGNPSEGAAKEVAILGSITSIVAANGEVAQAVLTGSEIQELSKYDLEKITVLADKNFLGPNMALELDGSVPCRNCEFAEKRLIPIDWRYDSFFSTSSQ
jgi:hypothetical protein